MYSLSKLLFLLFITLHNFNFTLQRVWEYTYNFEWENGNGIPQPYMVNRQYSLASIKLMMQTLISVHITMDMHSGLCTKIS